MTFKLTISKILVFLWIILILVTLAVFSFSIQRQFPDSVGYINMGLGLMEGKFSSWYFLEDFYPETLRMPGYPLFLGVLIKIFGSQISIFAIQYILLLFTYYLLII
jgi:hypothetical protein